MDSKKNCAVNEKCFPEMSVIQPTEAMRGGTDNRNRIIILFVANLSSLKVFHDRISTFV